MNEARSDAASTRAQQRSLEGKERSGPGPGDGARDGDEQAFAVVEEAWGHIERQDSVLHAPNFYRPGT